MEKADRDLEWSPDDVIKITGSHHRSRVNLLLKLVDPAGTILLAGQWSMMF